MKKALSMLLVMVMTLACLSGAAMADSDKYLGVMLSTNVMSLDTNLATDGESFEVIADCIDGLMQMDAAGASIPALAESYDMSEDGLTYTFHLRDAKWSNGTPVTASDFVFAWRRICKEAGEYAYMFGSSVGCVKGAQDIIDGKAEPDTLAVSAPDDKTLVVELESPVSFFASLMYFPTFYPINEAFYSSLEEGTYGTSPETFLSNGAFVLESYTPGTASLTVKRNPDYWDADRVKLAGIKYQVVGSSDNALVAFKTGALDVVTISGNQVASAKKDADLASKLAVTGAGYMWYLTFSQTEKNADGGMLANANLRLAISNAIDRESIVENNVMDGSLATYTAVPPQFAASSTTGADFSEDQMKFVDYSDFNMEKALEYLAKAKEELGKDSFTFTLIYGNNEGDVIAKVAQAIKSQVEANLPGVTLNLQPMTKAERLDKMQNDNYDVALTRWGPDYADPMSGFDPLLKSSIGSRYGSIFMAEDGYDAELGYGTFEKMALEANSITSDLKARYEGFAAAEKYLLDQSMVIPCFLSAGGYQACKLDPFSGMCGQMGDYGLRKLKGAVVLEKSMNCDEYAAAKEKYIAERTEARLAAEK